MKGKNYEEKVPHRLRSSRWGETVRPIATWDRRPGISTGQRNDNQTNKQTDTSFSNG